MVGIVRRASAAGLLYVPLTGVPRVLDETLPGLLNPVYTGDGKAIMVLSSNRNSNSNIAMVSAESSNPTPIFHSRQRNSFLALSPYKRQIAFV